MEVTEFEVLRTRQRAVRNSAGTRGRGGSARSSRKPSATPTNRNWRVAAPKPACPRRSPERCASAFRKSRTRPTQTVDTRALRTRIITELEQQKIEAIPMAAAPQAELDARAQELGVDYLLMAEITELKTSKPGGLTKVMKATAKEEARDITEAKLSVQLVPPGGKPQALEERQRQGRRRRPEDQPQGREVRRLDLLEVLHGRHDGRAR